MYELKNIIAAVALSIAIIVLYTLFFAPSPEEMKQNRIKQEKVQKDSDMPSVDQNENFVKITRNEALAENNRIQFENDDVVGSISLKGAIIDDLTFKKYNVVLNGKEKVVLLSPRKVQNGYFVESGFVTTNKNIEIPNSSTLWEISGNKKLTKNNPIKLTWKNPQGITSVSYTHLTLPTKA